jgi:UDP:flavonoid glycosyltransferase YjiC (YdhE family)
MRFTIAAHGTRGDVEPAAAIARELWRRGHEVTMAVPPNLIEFAMYAGPFSVVAYGPDSQRQLESPVFRDWYKLRNPFTVFNQVREFATEGWAEMSRTLATHARGADLILGATTYQELASNVSEALGIPFAALHYFPLRANNHLLPIRLPKHLVTLLWATVEWAHWQLLKPVYDAQRRGLGLPESKIRAARRIVEQGTLEIQAYDRLFFPRLEKEWGPKRPLVGGMTLELTTTTDESVMSWIAAGRAPIYFGFGSMPLGNPTKTFEMIVKVCEELGERALICAGISGLSDVIINGNVKIVRSVNHTKVFPLCRAIAHHGGAGTTAASIRAGVPTLVLWVGAEQPVWAARIKRLGVGTSRRLSKTTEKTLRDDLRITLGQPCTVKAREVAHQMTSVSESLKITADLLEKHAAHRAYRRPAG